MSSVEEPEECLLLFSCFVAATSYEIITQFSYFFPFVTYASSSWLLSLSYGIKMSSRMCSVEQFEHLISPIEQFEHLISPIVQFHDHLNYDEDNVTQLI